MADILIRGMEMPGCCGDCQFQASRWTGDFCSAGQFMFSIDFDYRDKHPKCPLVPIPEKHGRLIDADELMEIIRAHDYPLTALFNSTDNGMFTLGIQQAVDEVTTIVPAEGGGEDG